MAAACSTRPGIPLISGTVGWGRIGSRGWLLCCTGKVWGRPWLEVAPCVAGTLPCAAFEKFAHDWLSLSCSLASLLYILACRLDILVTKSEQVFFNILRLSSVVLTRGAGGRPHAPFAKTGDEANKLLDMLLPVMSSWVFRTSSMGDIAAGHSRPVGGSCLVPQDVHIRPALLAATGRLRWAGVCPVVLLPNILMGTVQ